MTCKILLHFALLEFSMQNAVMSHWTKNPSISAVISIALVESTHISVRHLNWDCVMIVITWQSCDMGWLTAWKYPAGFVASCIFQKCTQPACVYQVTDKVEKRYNSITNLQVHWPQVMLNFLVASLSLETKACVWLYLLLLNYQEKDYLCDHSIHNVHLPTDDDFKWSVLVLSLCISWPDIMFQRIICALSNTQSLKSHIPILMFRSNTSKRVPVIILYYISTLCHSFNVSKSHPSIIHCVYNYCLPLHQNLP